MEVTKFVKTGGRQETKLLVLKPNSFEEERILNAIFEVIRSDGVIVCHVRGEEAEIRCEFHPQGEE